MSDTRGIHDFTELLRIEATDEGHYVAEPPGDGFLFGGLTMALMLRAAHASARDGLAPRSLHAVFLNAGHWGSRLDLAVAAVSDTRAFATRQVTMTQAGRTVAVATIALHEPEAGDDWQSEAPGAPDPEGLPARKMEFASNSAPAEMRPVFPSAPGHYEKIHPFWGRSLQSLEGRDPILRWCAVVFMSDYLVISTPFARGSGGGRDKLSRTLGHTMWFHRPPSDDDWLLYSCDALSVHGGRYLSSGRVHDRQHRHLAAFTQEGMIRPAPSQPR